MKLFDILKIEMPALTPDALQRLQREVEMELASFTPALLAKAFRVEL